MRLRKINFKILIILLLLGACITGVLIEKDNIKLFLTPKDIIKVNEIKAELGNKIKSGSLATDYNVAKVIDDIYKFRFNTINVPVVVDIDSNSPDEMKINNESKNKAIELIKKLKRLGINIILEPYPYLDNGQTSETQWNPKNINTWFWNWKTEVLNKLIEEIAVPYKVYALNIASNLAKIEKAQNYWCNTIDYVRKSYKGLVTYRTNHWSTAVWAKITTKDYQERLNNPLFSKLDFISISAYFELTGNATNSVTKLTKALYSTDIYSRKQNIYQEIKNFYLKTGKPIFFGELGFPKRNGASVMPWNPAPSNIVNEQEQANCFQAYKNVFEKEDWIKGISVFFIGDLNESREYYPGKESTNIIKNWFTMIK